MEKVIRVGVAGFGMAGQIFHAPYLHADPHFAIRKVYERSSEHAKKEYPYAEIVRSFDALLTGDIDLVVIGTPNQTHVAFAKQAIAAGKHVIVEKPVAATAAEALELTRLARERGVFFTVNQNRRLDGDFLTLKKLLESGRLGTVTDYVSNFDRYAVGYNYRDWRRVEEKGVDTLYDLGVHLIDQAYVLFGLPKQVYADLDRQRPESFGVDRFTVILYYEGFTATLRAGELAVRAPYHYCVYGTKGSFIKDGVDPQERDIAAGLRPSAEHWGEDDPAHYGRLYLYEDGAVREERIPTEVGNYGVFYERVYDTLTTGADFFVKGEETAEVLRIIEAAVQSDREQRRITL